MEEKTFLYSGVETIKHGHMLIFKHTKYLDLAKKKTTFLMVML